LKARLLPPYKQKTKQFHYYPEGKAMGRKHGNNPTSQHLISQSTQQSKYEK
jgi:hypothetical protein